MSRREEVVRDIPDYKGWMIRVYEVQETQTLGVGGVPVQTGGYNILSVFSRWKKVGGEASQSPLFQCDQHDEAIQHAMREIDRQ